MIPLFFTLSYFNSHAHVERDLVKITFTELVSNFNSHAHVERDTTVFCLLSLAGISTHTLTWSVTFICPKLNQ